jgi:predicted nucleic acid-binding protein
MVLIDSSAWVEFFRRKGNLEVKLSVACLRNEMQAAICGPVAMEILGGARDEDRSAISGDFALLPWLRGDERLWLGAATNYSKLRAAAVIAPWNDVLIATVALRYNSRVYAPDAHFPLMAPILGLKLYEPGPNGNYRPDHDSL